MGRPKNSKMQDTHLTSRSAPVPSPGVSKVKTDGRIGSPTPPGRMKGGLTVDNNRKAGPNAEIGSQAASHMSPGHQGGGQWSPRVAKARAMAVPYPREHGHPINAQSGPLKKVKPS